MEYWNDTITEKSWNKLIELKQTPIRFILIGGWAAYLWTRMHKSKDIDIALSEIEDLDYLKQNYTLKKNDNLKKYEISLEEIDVDIYVPYYSKLAIPPEELKDYVTAIENISVISPEALLVLKQGAELERGKTIKGGKDRIDIIALLCFAKIDFRRYNEILKKYKLEHYRQRLKEIIKGFDELKYLGLNPREYKIKKKELMERV